MWFSGDRQVVQWRQVRWFSGGKLGGLVEAGQVVQWRQVRLGGLVEASYVVQWRQVRWLCGDRLGGLVEAGEVVQWRQIRWLITPLFDKKKLIEDWSEQVQSKQKAKTFSLRRKKYFIIFSLGFALVFLERIKTK